MGALHATPGCLGDVAYRDTDASSDLRVIEEALVNLRRTVAPRPQGLREWVRDELRRLVREVELTLEAIEYRTYECQDCDAPTLTPPLCDRCERAYQGIRK